METLWFFLPVVLLLGFVTSYTDIKKGKIRNMHIILALLYILISYSIIIFYYNSSGIPIRFSYIFDLGLNMLIALIFGFVAWHFKVWSAADGKLFLAYSGLVPLTAYSNTYFAYFPSFVLLINTFFPIFIYYAIKSVFFTGFKDKVDFFKRIKVGMVTVLILNVFWITWISRLVAVFIKTDIGFLGNILIMMSIILFIRRVATVWKISLPLSLLRIVFDYSYVFTLEFLWQFIAYSIILISIFFVLMFSGNLYTRVVDIKYLRSGMILSDHIYCEKGKYKKVDELEAFELLERGIVKKKDWLRISKSGEGLTEEDIEKIKKLKRCKKLDFSNIGVVQMLPFSPFLFLGVILTITASGNFILLIRHIL